MMYDLPPGVPFSSPFSLQRDAPPGLQPQYLSAPPSKRGGQLRAKAAMKVGAPPREGGSSEFCRSLLRRTIEDLETVVPRGVENDVNDEIIRMEPEKSTTKWTNIFQMQCSVSNSFFRTTTELPGFVIIYIFPMESIIILLMK
jgi:hypothetical protein